MSTLADYKIHKDKVDKFTTDFSAAWREVEATTEYEIALQLFACLRRERMGMEQCRGRLSPLERVTVAEKEEAYKLLRIAGKRAFVAAIEMPNRTKEG